MALNIQTIRNVSRYTLLWCLDTNDSNIEILISCDSKIIITISESRVMMWTYFLRLFPTLSNILYIKKSSEKLFERVWFYSIIEQEIWLNHTAWYRTSTALASDGFKSLLLVTRNLITIFHESILSDLRTYIF